MTVPTPANYSRSFGLTIGLPAEQTNGAWFSLPIFRSAFLENAGGDVGDGSTVGLATAMNAPYAELPAGPISGPNTFEIYLKVCLVPVRIIAVFDDGLGGTPYEETYDMGPSAPNISIDINGGEVLQSIRAERLF